MDLSNAPAEGFDFIELIIWGVLIECALGICLMTVASIVLLVIGCILAVAGGTRILGFSIGRIAVTAAAALLFIAIDIFTLIKKSKKSEEQKNG